MSKFFYFKNVALSLIIGMLFFSCDKKDEPDYWYDDYEDVITQGSDMAIDSEVFRVDNLLYRITGENTCELISTYFIYDEQGREIRYGSTLPYPVLDIPSEVIINGIKYSVESVNLYQSIAEHYISNKWQYLPLNYDKITYVTIPSSVLSIKAFTIKPSTLIIGANVRSVCALRATKMFWLPNTKPDGYEFANAKIAYSSSSSYGSEVEVYPHLSSMFNVDGIVYIMTSPSERTCDIVDIKGDVKSTLNITGEVTNENITFTIGNINSYSFYECNSINNLNIAKISSIGDYAFSSNNMESLTLSEIRTIGNYCFNNCDFSKVEIPNTVSKIGCGAFSNCENLEEISFLDGDSKLTLSINNSSYPSTNNYSYDIFQGTNLQKLYIGRDLNYITSYSSAPSPFYRLDTLKEVEIHQGETEISDNMFYGCIALNSVIIGEDIIKIGQKAFSGCSAMKSFRFGSQLKSIGSDAFSDCTALISFTSEALIPPTCGSQALDDINKWDCTLYVPNESIELYKEAPQWKDFLKIE